MKSNRFIIFLVIISIFFTVCSCSTPKEELDPTLPTVEEVKKPEPVIYPMTEITEPVPIPVLMYHAFTEAEAEPDGLFVSVSSFDRQLAALKEAGYTAITPHQLDMFMTKKSGLPEKPIIITMDDGYETNLRLAAPILEKHKMNATIFVIGVSIDNKMHPVTGQPFTPERFEWEEASEWVNKGVIEIQSHSYDMHKRKSGGGHRDGIMQAENESQVKYILELSDDFVYSKKAIERNVDTSVISLAFPFGFFNDTASEVFALRGAKIQFTSDLGCTSVMPDEGYSYIRLNRWAIGDEITGERIVERLDELKANAVYKQEKTA